MQRSGLWNSSGEDWVPAAPPGDGLPAAMVTSPSHGWQKQVSSESLSGASSSLTASPHPAVSSLGNKSISWMRFCLLEDSFIGRTVTAPCARGAATGGTLLGLTGCPVTSHFTALTALVSCGAVRSRRHPSGSKALALFGSGVLWRP